MRALHVIHSWHTFVGCMRSPGRSFGGARLITVSPLSKYNPRHHSTPLATRANLLPMPSTTYPCLAHVARYPSPSLLMLPFSYWLGPTLKVKTPRHYPHLRPYSTRRSGKGMQTVEVAKTHEIMARFRPIAPKPELPANPALEPARRPAIAALHLRTRPCRTRKRARTPAPPPLPIKHLRPTNTLVHPLITHHHHHPPVERDLLQELQKPTVITPLPVRPVGSSITLLRCIKHPNSATMFSPALKKPEKVEEELELESLPAVVSDSKNKVRLVNLAYKEMVGQPECPWLDSVGAGGSRRINGEVMLDVPENHCSSLLKTGNGFSCRVRIEWACNGRKKMVDVQCDVVRLYCDYKDYSFAWRFLTNQTSV